MTGVVSPTGATRAAATGANVEIVGLTGTTGVAVDDQNHSQLTTVDGQITGPTTTDSETGADEHRDWLSAPMIRRPESDYADRYQSLS